MTSPHRLRFGPALVLIVVLLATMTWLRLAVFPHRVVPFTYAVPLLVALWHRDRRLHWGLAGGFLVLSAYKFFVDLEGQYPETVFAVFWAMQLANILVPAVVIDGVNLLRTRLDARNAALAASNLEISRQNEELEQQNEELQQQAEELQEQAEELGTQAEDLRLLNLELGRREATLEGLLTVAGESESVSETLGQICFLARDLTEAAAGVILERQGEAFVVIAQHGLAQREQERIPVARSLAALILQKGETGFLADTALRPDIQVPVGLGEGRPRSLISAPLRVWGELRGVLEVLNPEPCEWSETQVRLVQWLADQVSRVWERIQAEEERRRSREALQRLNEELERRVHERTALAEERAGRLREMSAELTRAEQRERRRLASLLHDHLQQMLVAARLHLGLIGKGNGAESRQQVVAQVDELLCQAIDTSRSLTVELSPPILHDAGLAAGLEWLARSYRQKHDFEVELAVEAGLTVKDEDLRVFAYEATRELLFNVVKHAGVGRARAEAGLDRQGQLRITVSDRGCGLADGGRVLADKGGFGLFSIQQRAELLGGELSLSCPPSGGTEVTLLLPVGEREAAGEALSPASAVPHRRRGAAARGGNGRVRILVVDDHAVVRHGLAAMLDCEPGLDVVGEAGDGLEAIRQALDLRPDVVIMDVSMPHLDGVEATRQLAAEGCPSRVIGLSMYEHEDRGRAMLEAGAWDYLSKDAPGGELIARIRAVSAARERGPVPSGG